MKAYVLRILVGAMICGIIRSLCDRKLVGLLCGIYLTALVLMPGRELRLELPDLDSFGADARASVEAGAAQAQNAEDAIIKQRCEAYILDEAAARSLSLSVEVMVEAGVPAAVRLEGSCSAGDREALARFISRNLGIGKEAQIWPSSYQSSLPP